MRRRHVAIFTLPVSAHVFPVLELCLELEARGYRVTYVTTDALVSAVESVRAEPIIVKPSTHSDDVAQGKWKTLRVLPPEDPAWWVMYGTEGYPGTLAFATEVLMQVESFYNENVPDLILYDPISFAGRILALRLSRPAIQIFGSFAPYKGFLYRQNGRYVNPEPMLAFSHELDRFLKGHGIKETGNLWHSERLNIHFIPREFQYESESFGEQYRFVGACLNRPYSPSWKNGNRGTPIVLVSHLSDPATGTDTEYFRLFRDALAAMDINVILSIGKHINEDELKPLPSNIELNRVASHLEILPHAALFVGQAGTGSTLEALYHGVPTLLLPVTPFHEEVAARVVELGLGVRLTRTEVTETLVRETVFTMLNDGALRVRVGEMQAVFRRGGGARSAADEIENFLVAAPQVELSAAKKSKS